MNKLKLLSSSFIMALTLAAPFATYAMELEEDIGATASNGKRKAEEDKNPSKRTKPSATEDLSAENTLARLPSDVIDTISLFLDPNECFNLGLTCKSLGKHLPNLPMWQALIDRSELSQEESRPFFYKDLPKYYIFKMALSHNYQAKFTYAEWLLSHNLSQKVAARYLSEFINNTEAAPLKRCDAIHLIENFYLWNNVSDEVVRVLLSDISTQHPQMRDITHYLSCVMRVQKHVGLLILRDYRVIYQALVQSSQNPELPENMQTAANYYRAYMRLLGQIGDDLLTLADAYQLLAQLSQSPQLDLRARANYHRAVMRVQGRIGDDLLTLADAYQLLAQLSQRPQLDLRARANDFRAVMRVDGKIGDDLLTLPAAYQLFAQLRQSPHLDLRARANYHRAVIRFQSHIGDDLLTLADAYQLLLESSRNPYLPADSRAAATSLINQLKAQNRIPALLKDN